MKPIWYITGVACILISAIGRMANSVSDVLIALGVIAVFALVIWLFETDKIRINERLGKILKRIGTGLLLAVGIIYLGGMGYFAIYSVITTGSWYGIILLTVSGIIIGVLWYMSRWRRWWVKFLKTFTPKENVRYSDWGIREKYYWTFDYGTNAQYCLRRSNGIFHGQARVWLEPTDVDSHAADRLKYMETIMAERGIEANCAMIHLSGCIYANIIAETNYKSMNRSRQTAFREAFHELDRMNYRGDYYAKYHGELGTILFESSEGNISRAIRTEPREEYYLEPDCGFQSDEAYYFIERGVDWTEGTYSLISEKQFFNCWRERLEYNDKDDAFSFFVQASLRYFASVANGDKKEQTNSRWDIENAAKYIIAHNETEIMLELMGIYAETLYWAARLFSDVLPAETHEAAIRIVENCDNPEIVSHTKKLLTQWEKGGKR